MINYIKGNLLNAPSGLIIHGCNCSGGFGSGVAGAIRSKWPYVYNVFKKYSIGADMLGTFVPVKINENLFVGNCYTQQYFGSDGKRYASPEAIKESITKACEFAQKYNIKIISMPKIGTGLGGLNWDADVVTIIEDLANQFSSITINVYYID